MTNLTPLLGDLRGEGRVGRLSSSLVVDGILKQNILFLIEIKIVMA